MRRIGVICRQVLAAAFLVQLVFLSAVPAQAQGNSQQAIEAARRHRAATGGQRQAVPPSQNSSAATARPYRSTANPNADPNLSLRSCLEHVGMNMVRRDQCMRQHCAGKWGQGDCPAGGDVTGASDNPARSPYAKTALGRCLAQAGRNPFKRDACGWRHCNNRRNAPECAALMPHNTPPRSEY